MTDSTPARRLGRAAAEILSRSDQVMLLPGLRDKEIARAESWLGAEFAPEHREFLRAVLPYGEGWPDWRHLDRRAGYDWMFDAPVQGLLFDVRHNDLWPTGWGERPRSMDEALRQAQERLAEVPRLIPVYGHRYLPAGPCSPGHPVLSVHQSDVICYGADLEDYVEHEFWRGPGPRGPARAMVTVPFWRDLVE